jgi:hypothetical protein
MSHRRRRAPPGSRLPTNLAGMAFLEIEELRVGSWCPLPDGKGPATQVHMVIGVRGLDEPLIIRFKGPGTLDQLIESLQRHRADVWPYEPGEEPEV